MAPKDRPSSDLQTAGIHPGLCARASRWGIGPADAADRGGGGRWNARTALRTTGAGVLAPGLYVGQHQGPVGQFVGELLGGGHRLRRVESGQFTGGGGRCSPGARPPRGGTPSMRGSASAVARSKSMRRSRARASAGRGAGAVRAWVGRMCGMAGAPERVRGIRTGTGGLRRAACAGRLAPGGLRRAACAGRLAPGGLRRAAYAGRLAVPLRDRVRCSGNAHEGQPGDCPVSRRGGSPP